MPADITKYGVSGLKGLKGVNTNVSPEYQEALQSRNRTLRGGNGPTLRDTFSTFSYGEGSPMNNWGTSGYDNEIMNTPLTTEQIQDTRYENQPWYDTLANGVGKMLGTAATTFASSLFGLPYGLIRTGIAAVQGEENPWSNLWDNEITQGLSEVEDWMEKNMTNYKSTEQQNAPWYSLANLGSMNFWADDVIKNAGFTLGAAASMAVGSGALGLLSKSMGMVNKASTGTKVANGFLSALFSATGEGMIEAKNGVDERNKLEIQRLNDALAPERQALQMELNEIEQDYALTGDYEAYKRRLNDYTVKKDYFDQKEAAGMEEIERTGKDMGNKILMGNQALLTAGNLIQFGKLMNKSFNNARHAAETASKSAKPSMWRDGFTATRNSADDITKGYGMSSKNLGRLRAGTKGLLTEGSEEMNQQWIQSGAGAAYNEVDVNDYWKAKLDPEAYRDTTEGLYTLGSALSQGFNESWGDVNQWEQFVIGGLTGMAGSYSPTKLFNQDKTKSRWDPRRYGSWEGGAYNEIRDFNEQYDQYAENIDDLNKILDQEDFGARMQNLIAHSFLERRKEQAAKDNDMKTRKDEDDKQTVHDIQAFYRAGKIDDLRALYDEMSQNMSDADVESIINRTTKVTTAEEDRENYYAALDEEIEKKQKDVNDLYNQLESVQADHTSGNTTEEEAVSKTKDLTSRISNAEAEVGRLTEERNKKGTSEGYNGTAKYEGPYVDITGNKIKTYDEVKEEIKHNSESLQRKLDSYLDSIAEVNRRTGGNLTKDQEDNLAYLHNMGRSSIRRADDIVEGIRQDLPAKFLFKTDKTPEQLAKEYASSDLAFTKDDGTPEGYVNVDASMLAGHNFTDFLIRDIIWGRNQRHEFGETADERAAREEEEKNLDEEERNKRKTARWKKQYDEARNNAEEQRQTNLGIMIDTFADNYKKRNRATEAEVDEATGEFIGNIVDALGLMQQAGEFEKTLNDYMKNPQKVDEAKAKEEEKANKKNKEEDQKNKFAGKTAKDINNDIANGDLSIDDVDDFLGADLSDVTDEDSKSALENAKQEAQKSKDIRQKQAEVKGAIVNNAEENDWDDAAVDAALNAVDTMAANAEDAADINLDNVGDFINPADVEGASTGEDEMADLSQQVQDMVASGLNSWKESQDKKDDIPDPSTAVSIEDEPEDTGHDSTTKMPADTASPKVNPTENNDEWEQPVPVNSLDSSAVSKVEEEVNKEGEENNQSAPWRSTTRRYGRQRISGNRWGTARVPYHELVSDKNSVLYKRSKAIWEYLESQGAWDNVDNVEKDKIGVNDTIHFMVKNFAEEIFGKPFEDLSEKEKPQALAILMLDDGGRVLGDLPLAQFERGYNDETSLIKSPQLVELKGTQEKLFKAFEERRAKTGCNEAIADKGLNRDGAENLNLTFNNARRSPLVSKISQMLNGVVPFSNEINTLNDIMGSKDLLLGISVTGETIATSRDKKDRRGGAARPIRVANVGQSYILIPSPSGALMPVPFYTKPFDAQSHAGTQLYRVLSEALTNLVNNAGKSDTSTYKESMDVLEGLLQVRAQEGAKTTIEVTKDNVTLHLQSLTNPDQHIDIKVVNTGNAKDAAKEFLNYLSSTPINISLQFINSKIGVKNGTSAPYNRVIGEIADANLPKDTTHTVNNAFLIKLTTDAGTQRTEVRYQQSGTQTFNVGDKTVKVDIDKFMAYQIDPTTKEETLIEGDEEVNNLLAEIKASQQADKTKPFKIELDGQIRTYDPVKKEFIRTSQGSGVNAGEASINQQKEDRKNGNAGEAASTRTETQRETAVEQQSVEQPTETPPLVETQQQPVERKAKTIEEINKEVGEAGIINKRNKDAWDAISDSLKLKMVNEGIGIVLEYGGSEVTLDYRDFEQMKNALKEANKYAKSGSMTAREGAKYRRVTTEQERKANIRREKEWMQKNLPMFSTEERLHLIQGLLEIPGEKNWAWGRFEKGIITLSDRAARGTLYHEAFHAVTQTLLSDDELNALYDAAVKHYKETDVAYVEELLAEDFRRYVQMEETPVLGPIRRFFKKIMNAIRNLSGYRAPIQKLFYRINNGEFSESIPKKAKSNNAFYSTASEYYLDRKDPQIDYIIKDGISRGLKEGRKDDIIGRWDRYINHWIEKGFRPVGHWEDSEHRYVIDGVMTYPDYLKWIEEDYAEADAEHEREKKEKHQAQQARDGRERALRWENLDPETVQALIKDGKINQKRWEQLSLEEKEQYQQCY